MTPLLFPHKDNTLLSSGMFSRINILNMFMCYGTDKGFIKVSNKDSVFSIAPHAALDSHKHFHLGAVIPM